MGFFWTLQTWMNKRCSTWGASFAIPSEIFSEYLKFPVKDAICAVNLNAHNPLWGDHTSDFKGQFFIDMLI